MANGINIPGVKEPIPPWVLGVGGAGIIAFIILSRQGGGTQTASGDNTGLLAAELDQRFNDLWQQLYNQYAQNTGNPPVTPHTQPPDSGGIPPMFLGPPISNSEGTVHVTQPAYGWSDTQIGKIFPWTPPVAGENVPTPPIYPPPGGIISPPDVNPPQANVNPPPPPPPDVNPPGTGIHPPLIVTGSGGPRTYLSTFQSGEGMYPYYPVIPSTAPMPSIGFDLGSSVHDQHLAKVIK